MSDDLSAARRSVCAALAELTGFEHAVFVQSGTAAIEVALSVLTDPGARVTVPALGCWTVAHAVKKVGREPLFVDVDEHWGVRPAPRSRAAASILIDPWGAPSEWRAKGSIRAMGAVIADVTHAPGATLAGERVATFCDAAILSFGWGKPIALGGGGCALFRDAKAAEEAGRLLRFGFFDGRWVREIDRYTFSPFLFPALRQTIERAALALGDDIASAQRAQGALASGSFSSRSLRKEGQWGLSSVVPLRVSESFGLTPRELESVAVSSGVPLVRHPVAPAYLEPAWVGAKGHVPRCPRAEAIGKSLLCFERIRHPDELAALRDFLDRVAVDVDRFRAPFQLPRPRGRLSAELRELADRARLARSLDGELWLLDEVSSRKIRVSAGEAALLQRLQEGK